MYNQFRNYFLVSIYLLLSACGGGGGSDDDPGNISSGTNESTIRVVIRDAHAGLVNSGLKLKFSGVTVKEKGKTLTSKSFADSDDKELILSASKVNTATPLTILANAPGYLDTGSSIVVKPDIDVYEVNLKMVKDGLGESVEGVYTAEKDISAQVDDNGKVTSPITLESKKNPTTPGVSISIPQNTILSGGDGKPVTDGILKITSFDPSSHQAVAAYPGGLNVIADAKGFNALDGSAFTGDAEIDFKTAGFAAISITDSADRKVKSFSQDVSISMEVKQGAEDSLGNSVGSGTPIPVWSYDEDTGKWSFESQDKTLSSVDTNQFHKVTFQTKHLTYWNIDWHYGAKCAPRFNFLQSDGTPDLTAYSFHLVVESTPQGVDKWMNSGSWYNYNNDGFIELKNVPANFPGYLEIYKDGALIEKVDVTNFCKSDATSSTGHDTSVGEVFDVTINCDNDNCIVNTPVNMLFSCPVGNVPDIGFAAILSPVNGAAETVLDSSGAGSVASALSSSTVYNVSPNSSQAGLFSAITNSSVLPITVTAGTPSTTTLMLSNNYCSSASGDIDCNNIPDPDSTWSPWDVVEASDGARYVSVSNHPGQDQRIEKITNTTRTTLIPHGVPTTYSTLTPVSQVVVDHPAGMDLYRTDHAKGDILVYADYGANCINALFLGSMEVITIAGQCGGAGNHDGLAHESRLNVPADVAFTGSADQLYITDVANRSVRRLGEGAAGNGGGLLSTLLGLGAGDTWASTGMLVDTFAGTGQNPTDDTYAANPKDSDIAPFMLDVAPDGSVVIAEKAVGRISRITETGISRLAGFAGQGSSVGNPIATGVASTDASVKFKYPHDIEIDDLGNILIADDNDQVVRKISAGTSSIITTVAGTGAHNGGMQCGSATQVNVARPIGLWISENGGFYLTQAKNGTYSGWLRKVNGY